MCSRALLLILLSSGIAACSNEQSHRVIHTEIDGVPQTRTVGGPLYEGPIFELTSDLVLGIDEGEPEWQIFGNIWSIFAPDGRMVIGDYRRSEIYIISMEGKLLHQLGGKGAGPGEFRNLWLMHWIDPGEEFWVEDQMLPYMNKFSMSGEFLDTINDTHLGARNTFVQPLSRNRFLASYGERRGEKSVSVYGFLDAALQWSDDFQVLQSQPSFKTSAAGYRPIPFTAGEGCTATPDGRILVTRPDVGRIELYSAEGKLQQYIDREAEGIWIGSQEFESGLNISGDFAYRQFYAESGSPRIERFRLIALVPEAEGSPNH